MRVASRRITKDPVSAKFVLATFPPAELWKDKKTVAAEVRGHKHPSMIGSDLLHGPVHVSAKVLNITCMSDEKPEGTQK